MILLAVLVYILEALFLTGMIGSAVVILLSGIEDVETIFEEEEPAAH